MNDCDLSKLYNKYFIPVNNNYLYNNHTCMLLIVLCMPEMFGYTVLRICWQCKELKTNIWGGIIFVVVSVNYLKSKSTC